MENTKPKNVYITLHTKFVQTDISYTDKNTGEEKTFNLVTMPDGMKIDGQDVGRYQFSPLYINDSKYLDQNFKDIPLLPDNEVWLQKSIYDEYGNPQLGDDGKRQKDTIKVMPEKLKESLRQFSKEKQVESQQQSLTEKSANARGGAEALAGKPEPTKQKAVVK